MSTGRVRSDGTRWGTRGLTPIVALVLLMGLVAAVSVGIFVFASDSMSDAQSNTETEQAERSFSEMSSEVDSAGTAGETRETDLSLQQGDSIDSTESGSIEVVVGNETVADENLTAFTHTTSDGTPITYEGGAVWRNSGAETQLVSAPPVEIGNESEERTVSLPLTSLSADGSLDTNDPVVASPNGTSDTTHQEWANEPITIEIESDYHAGWEAYFEDVAERVEGVEIEDGSDDSVVVTFGVGDFEDQETVFDDGYFENVATIDGNLTTADLGDSMDTTGPVNASGSIENYDPEALVNLLPWVETEREAMLNEDVDVDRKPHDEVIEDMVEQGNESGWESTDEAATDVQVEEVSDPVFDIELYELRDYVFEGDGGDEPTYYFLDEWNQDRYDEAVIDVADGDAVIVVDGDMEIEGGFTETFGNTTDIEVKNADSGHTASIFVNGDVTFDRATACSTNCDLRSGTPLFDLFESDPPDEISAEALQVYGTSTSDINFEGKTGTIFEGILSAPPGNESRSDASYAQLMLLGALDTGDASFIDDLDLIHDDDLDEQYNEPAPFSQYEGEGPIYLDVSERSVELTND